jgi:hypothetical protein
MAGLNPMDAILAHRAGWGKSVKAILGKPSQLEQQFAETQAVK